jgi:hypothetical protein
MTQGIDLFQLCKDLAVMRYNKQHICRKYRMPENRPWLAPGGEVAAKSAAEFKPIFTRNLSGASREQGGNGIPVWSVQQIFYGYFCRIVG